MRSACTICSDYKLCSQIIDNFYLSRNSLSSQKLLRTMATRHPYARSFKTTLNVNYLATFFASKTTLNYRFILNDVKFDF